MSLNYILSRKYDILKSRKMTLDDNDQIQADANKGKTVFMRVCSQCHSMDDKIHKNGFNYFNAFYLINFSNYFFNKRAKFKCII